MARTKVTRLSGEGSGMMGWKVGRGKGEEEAGVRSERRGCDSEDDAPFEVEFPLVVEGG
ncbi:hypothetical protein BDY24DRAFT_375927 [Mrakia frigida]|uniref:uncharacterized protein n=1 Tax=Mrakia frigida TaxID=29902 RepID=UPI003FCC146F